MKTPFDFISIALFAVIAVFFLHRSAKEERDPVPIWAYALIAAGCALGDVLANYGYVAIGAVFLIAAAGGIGSLVLRSPTLPRQDR